MKIDDVNFPLKRKAKFASEGKKPTCGSYN